MMQAQITIFMRRILPASDSPKVQLWVNQKWKVLHLSSELTSHFGMGWVHHMWCEFPSADITQPIHSF